MKCETGVKLFEDRGVQKRMSWCVRNGACYGSIVPANRPKGDGAVSADTSIRRKA